MTLKGRSGYYTTQVRKLSHNIWGSWDKNLPAKVFPILSRIVRSRFILEVRRNTAEVKEETTRDRTHEGCRRQKWRQLTQRDRECALTQLVWKFLTKNGHRCADALENRHGEGGTNSQAIDEIVETVAQGDHPSQGTNIRVSDPLEPVASTLRCLQVLRESTSQWTRDDR